MSLEHLFHDNTVVKILDFFIDHQKHEYKKNEVAIYTGINNIKNITWKFLEENEFIKPIRKIENSTFYTLNIDNPVVKKLLEFDWEFTKYRALKIAARESTKLEKLITIPHAKKS
ncbi:MAG: hypothetical protein ACE5KT_06140 [Methanosarcinales archaeon]